MLLGKKARLRMWSVSDTVCCLFVKEKYVYFDRENDLFLEFMSV